jgi:predicted Co/Zn/Cd cation transporter (cation efflux family)
MKCSTLQFCVGSLLSVSASTDCCAYLACLQERTATRIIGVLLLLLGCSAVGSSIYRLVTGGRPTSTTSGIVISAVSLSFMGLLWWGKVKVGALVSNSSTIVKVELIALSSRTHTFVWPTVMHALLKQRTTAYMLSSGISIQHDCAYVYADLMAS